MLSAEEVLSIKEHLWSNQQKYLAAAEHVKSTCLNFKVQQPQILRVIFQREPPIKTVPSVLAKIQKIREKYGNPTYSVQDLNDVIAFTVLCPYDTDVKEFVGWMRASFLVHTSEEDAIRDYSTGHRARHYVVSAISNPATFTFAGIRCELQVKTILQEAFDAKSHDLAYKPKSKVSDEVLEQFALLSAALKSLDGQSEFLKSLILREKKEVAYRRDACMLLYFEQAEVKKAAALIDLNVDKLPEMTELATVLRKYVQNRGVSREFCKLAALCAMKCNADYLRAEALQYADQFLAEGSNEARRYLVRGSVKWLTGRSEQALVDVATAIAKASQQLDESVILQSKNNFVYFVADWKASESSERQDFNEQAKTYVNEFTPRLEQLDSQISDTVGLFLVAFGENEDEVEQGRAYLRIARKRRDGDPTYPNFYRYHDYLALRRLLEMGNLALADGKKR